MRPDISYASKMKSLFSLVVLIFLSSNAHSRVSEVEVNTFGAGADEAQAIWSALSQAISQVNGATIATKSVLEVQEAVLLTGNSEEVLQSESFSNLVEESTNGVVSSWRLISIQQESNGRWRAEVSAKIGVFNAGPQQFRLRLAIAEPRVKNQAELVFAKRFVTELENQLTSSRRFAMLDRAFTAEQNAELKAIRDGGFKSIEQSRLNQRLGTDYLIVVDVDRAISNVIEREMKTTGRILRRRSTEARINYRVIDVATTQVKFAKTVESSGDSDLDAFGRKLASLASTQILQAIFPTRVLLVEGDELVLGQGGSTLEVGQSMRVLELTETLTDPYTGESLGRREIDRGLVVVSDVQPKYAIARTKEGKSLTSGPEYIVRPILDDQSLPMVPKNIQPQPKPKVSIEQLKEKNDDDW